MTFDFNGTLFALSFALDCVEHDLLGAATGHGKRVAALSVLLGCREGLELSVEERQILCALSVMHDCALSEYVEEEAGGSVEKAAKLLPFNLGKHCLKGEESIRYLPFDNEKMAGAILFHHENADGSGPFGKKSVETPCFARLIHAADITDVMFDLNTVDAEKKEKIRAIVKKSSGKLFDARESEALISALESPEFDRLTTDKIDRLLRVLLPGGEIACTPQELIDFASVFAQIVDYKSRFTRNHSIGIAQKAKIMGAYYGQDEEMQAKLYFAGALHDIGKLAVDRDVLEKPDKLNDREYLHIQTHAYVTYKVLSAVPGLEDITAWASHHHEKLDGSGYPFGLTGEKMGQWERLLACLDIYQALTEDRPYKAGISHEKAVGILWNMVEKNKLDGDIVRDIDRRFAPEG